MNYALVRAEGGRRLDSLGPPAHGTVRARSLTSPGTDPTAATHPDASDGSCSYSVGSSWHPAGCTKMNLPDRRVRIPGFSIVPFTHRFGGSRPRDGNPVPIHKGFLNIDACPTSTKRSGARQETVPDVDGCHWLCPGRYLPGDPLVSSRGSRRQPSASDAARTPGSRSKAPTSATECVLRNRPRNNG